MKMKKLFLGISLTTALILVILLNQYKALGQSSSTGSCPTVSIFNPNSEIDSSTEVLCGTCTTYTVKPGWTPSDGNSAKYIVATANVSATVVTCMTSTSPHSCTAVMLNGAPSCPATPADLDNGTSGTDIATGTE